MAKIETITDDLGEPLTIINVSNSVGVNGVNDPEDVQVVKALFKFVPNKYHLVVGAKQGWEMEDDSLPLPYDGTTWGIPEITKSFQKYANKMLSKYGYKVEVSGRIKPAKYNAVVGKKYSTIVALNVFANLGGTNFYSGNYIDRIKKEYRGIFAELAEEESNG